MSTLLNHTGANQHRASLITLNTNRLLRKSFTGAFTQETCCSWKSDYLIGKPFVSCFLSGVCVNMCIGTLANVNPRWNLLARRFNEHFVKIGRFRLMTWRKVIPKQIHNVRQMSSISVKTKGTEEEELVSVYGNHFQLSVSFTFHGLLWECLNENWREGAWSFTADWCLSAHAPEYKYIWSEFQFSTFIDDRQPSVSHTYHFEISNLKAVLLHCIILFFSFF